jgi:hypothetical protein
MVTQMRVILQRCLEATDTGRSGWLFCLLIFARKANIPAVSYGEKLLDRQERVTTARELV